MPGTGATPAISSRPVVSLDGKRILGAVVLRIKAEPIARTFNVMIDVLRQRERERDGRRSVSIGYEKEEAPAAAAPEGNADNTKARR